MFGPKGNQRHITFYMYNVLLETVSNEFVGSAETNGQKAPTEIGFLVPTSGTAGYGKT
jgi:hypothetical protein